jgi:hypothetical protein
MIAKAIELVFYLLRGGVHFAIGSKLDSLVARAPIFGRQRMWCDGFLSGARALFFRRSTFMLAL